MAARIKSPKTWGCGVKRMAGTYTNNAQMRGYQTLKALFGHEVAGIECAELAKQLGREKAQVFKDLSTLQAAGFAEQLPDKRWRLSSNLAREAIKIMNGLDMARQRLDETARRYGAGL